MVSIKYLSYISAKLFEKKLHFLHGCESGTNRIASCYCQRPHEPYSVGTRTKVDIEKERKRVVGSVVDPDPHGSGTFAWIRIRNYCSGSGSS